DPRQGWGWRYALEPGSLRAVAIATLAAVLPLNPQALREQTLELIDDMLDDWDELCLLSWLDHSAAHAHEAARERAALQAFWRRRVRGRWAQAEPLVRKAVPGPVTQAAPLHCADAASARQVLPPLRHRRAPAPAR